MSRARDRSSAATARLTKPGRAAVPLVGLVLLVAAGGLAGGCYPPQLLTIRSGLDSLRTQVDTLMVRDSITYRALLDTRRELAEQRDVLLSTKAATGTTTKQLFDQMSRLDARLEEVGARFQQWNARQPAGAGGSSTAPPPAGGTSAPPPATGGIDANALYDQAALDLTQGRYTMALEGFREFVRRFPTAELADNAQYGIGECFFAQAKFDSAAAEYAKVETGWPQGDRIPAALYKLALCQEKLQQNAASRKTLEDLVKRYPLSGEAQLARERLGKR